MADDDFKGFWRRKNPFFDLFSEFDKMDDIMGFRNNSYASLMTGTMSPKHHTPWKDELDDSMEAYLKNV